MIRGNRNIDKYEWHLKNGSCLYGEDAYDYLMPKYRKARRVYYNILSLLHSYLPTGNLINDYLDIEEVLSVITIELRIFEETREKEE